MRNDRHVIRFGHGRDAARGGQTAAPLHLGLDDVSGTAFDDFVESLVVVLEIPGGELDRGNPFPQVSILAGGPAVLERVLKPLHIVLADPLRQSRGELHVPGEVAVDHDLHVVTQVGAKLGDQLLHFFNALEATFHAPWCGDLHAEKTPLLPVVGKVRMDGGVTGDRLLRLSANQLVNGNIEGARNQVVQGQVHTGHGHVGNSTQPVRKG